MSTNRAGWLFACGFAFAGCAMDSDDVVGTDELGTAVSSVNLADFTLPTLSAADRAPIVRKYDALDPTDLVPRGLLEDALVYYDVNKAHIPETRYVTVVDLSLYSGKDRFWLVDTTTGKVETHKVAHGDGSDPDNDGLATSFGNVDGSHKSSLGFYLTGEIYDGTHPHSMRLDGLTETGPNSMTNTNARSRLIVMHEASYVSDSNNSQQGRSNGCLALDPDIEAGVVDRIHDGSLIYNAKAQLAAPVGRAVCGDMTCDGSEDTATCAEDCGGPSDDPNDPPPTDDPTGDQPPMEVGGCSTSGGSASALLGLALAIGASRRRRR